MDKIVRLNRKHTLYMYKAMHAAHSALSYNVSYSFSLFLSRGTPCTFMFVTAQMPYSVTAL